MDRVQVPGQIAHCARGIHQVSEKWLPERGVAQMAWQPVAEVRKHRLLARAAQ